MIRKKQKVDIDSIPNVLFRNNLFLRADNWPSDVLIQDKAPLIGDPLFSNKGGLALKDYIVSSVKMIKNKGIPIASIPGDKIGLKIGLKVKHDILGNPIQAQPDLGAIELNDKK